MRFLLLLLVVAGCVPSGRAGVEPEPQQERWRTDWRAFWAAVEPHARAGAIEDNSDALAFNRVFWGEVEWTGTVRSLRAFPGSGVNVVIDMPPVLVPLSDGSSVQVRGLSLSCSERERGCAGWTQALIGRQVRFRTSLENRTRGNQPVVRTESSGKQRWIDIEAHGAELVGSATP